MSATLQERVARGAAYLDEREPDWWQRVEVLRLDMASTCRCVLGQLDEDHDYHQAIERRGMGCGSPRGALEVAMSLGFDVFYVADYSTLTALWRAEIEQRRRAAP